VCPSVEVLKPRSLLIKLSPRTRGPKNYSRPRVFISYFYFYEFLLLTFIFTSVSAQQLPKVLTSYFYFYVRFHATTTIVDGGDIFGIWRVGEEIWVRFFWAKGLEGSWFFFFGGGGGGGGVLGVLIGGSEPKW
jgi:hypothetical protein